MTAGHLHHAIFTDLKSRDPLPRNFSLLWLATAVSNIGDGVRLTAFPLLAASFTDDPRAIAGVAIAERLSWLAFILPGGALADSLDRRTLRSRLDLVRAFIMAALALSAFTGTGSIVLVWIAAALVAALEASVDSSSMALVPSLVDGPQLERAGARLSTTEVIANGMIGPPLGGILFGLAVGLPFIFDSATFAIAAGIVLTIRGDFSASPKRRVHLRGDLVEGFRWIWARSVLRSLALMAMGLGVASFIGDAIFVVFALRELELSATGFGLLLLPGAFGAVAGATLAGRLDKPRLVVWLPTALVLTGLSNLAISISNNALLVSGLLAISSSGVLIWNVLTVAYRQRVIPDALLGRVGASFRFLVFLGMPAGALVGGMIANWYGVRSALAVDGLAVAGLGVVALFVFSRPEQSEGA